MEKSYQSYSQATPTGQLDLSAIWNLFLSKFDWLSFLVEFDFFLQFNHSDIVRKSRIVIVLVSCEFLDSVVFSAFCQIVCSNQNFNVSG